MTFLELVHRNIEAFVLTGIALCVTLLLALAIINVELADQKITEMILKGHDPIAVACAIRGAEKPICMTSALREKQ